MHDERNVYCKVKTDVMEEKGFGGRKQEIENEIRNYGSPGRVLLLVSEFV